MELELLGILIIISICLVFSNVYAIEAGPQVPKTPSTQTQYCYNGQCLTSPVTIPANYTHSKTKMNVLLINLSNTCEMLNKLGSKDCTPVKDIIQYDNSNQRISGKFIEKNGIYTRTQPQIKNNWKVYEYSTKPIICVECTFDQASASRSQQIIIQPNTFTYTDKLQTVSNNKWVSYSNRAMQGCDTATIASVPGLLQDTITYMLSGCSVTSFNGTETHIIKQKLFSYNNPYSSLHQDSYLKSLMNGHTYDFGNKTSGGRGPSNCITHQCSFTDPYKKIGW